MTTRLKRAGIVSLLAWGILLSPGVSSNAEAAFILELTQGATTITIDDGSALDGAAGVPGLILFSGPVGTYEVNVSTGVSKPLSPNTPEFALMDLNSIDISTIVGGTLTISLTDTDFLAGPAGTLIGNVGGTNSDSATAEFFAYKDPSNAEFGTGGTSLHLCPLLCGSGAFSDTASALHGPLASPYSMTLVANITHAGGFQITSLDFEVKNVPEPASLMLLGVGLAGAGAAARRRSLLSRRATGERRWARPMAPPR